MCSKSSLCRFSLSRGRCAVFDTFSSLYCDFQGLKFYGVLLSRSLRGRRGPMFRPCRWARVCDPQHHRGGPPPARAWLSSSGHHPPGALRSGIIKVPSFTPFYALSSFCNFPDRATHLGENESEVKNFKIFQGNTIFFVDFEFYCVPARYGRRRSISRTANDRSKPL